jgi:DNA polymerase elongation subunit (family B)
MEDILNKYINAKKEIKYKFFDILFKKQSTIIIHIDSNIIFLLFVLLSDSNYPVQVKFNKDKMIFEKGDINNYKNLIQSKVNKCVEENKNINVYKLIIETNYKGEVIAGDTDSIFTHFNLRTEDRQYNLSKSIEFGVLVGEIVTRILHNEGYKNHELEYEKTLYPMIIVKKKTYAGVYYEWSNSKPYVLNMGLVTKKRGFSNILKKIYSKVLDYLLWEFSPESAIEYVSNCVKNINTFSIEDFIMTKKIKSIDDYANLERVPHAYLANEIRKRDPGNAPQSNDRIQFVYKKGNYSKNTKECKRIEEINYFLEKKMELDYEHYISNQLIKPLCTLLDFIMDEPESLFVKGKQMKIMDYFKI